MKTKPNKTIPEISLYNMETRVLKRCLKFLHHDFLYKTNHDFVNKAET